MKDRKEERNRLERMILSALITDYDRFIDYLDIPSDDFTEKNRRILNLIKESKTGDPTILSSKSNTVTIDELRELSAELISCSESDFENYVDTLKDLITKDKLTWKLNVIISNLNDWWDLWKVYQDLNNIKMEWVEEEKIWDVLYDLLLETSWEKEVKIIPTWYSELDKLIWWYEDWQIIVIGARPWIWKSMFAINLISNNINKWEKVALFSLEMNNKQVLRRLLALNSWVWVRKLKKKVEWEALTKVQQWFEKLSDQLQNFHCIDNVHTITEVERKIRQLTHKKGVKIFYLDYLQLIRNPAIKNNPVEALTDISQRLKQLALELDIVIVELSQLNRDADKTAVKRASQLRWSWSIEQDADMVWMLDKEDEESNKIQVDVQKCRDWRIWKIDLIQTSDIMLIKDLPPKPF